MSRKKIPETRYPHNLERAYAKRIIKMVDALGEVVLTEFDKQPELIGDASISEQIKSMINKIKGLSLGVFNEKDVSKAASGHVRAVSSSSKANINSQTAVSGVNPNETEPWLKEYTDVKVAENVSYITNIRDEYTKKIEQTIYRGVTEGKSNAEIKKELVEQTGMAENKAKFVARDQTGTLLGQMNAERHKNSGIEAFIWKDSDDGAVRDTHAERDEKLYYYSDNPLLPGTEYGCRCIAKPAFEEDIEEAEENGTAVHAKNNEKEEKQSLPENSTLKEKVEFIKNNVSGTPDESSVKEAGKIIGDEIRDKPTFVERKQAVSDLETEYEEAKEQRKGKKVDFSALEEEYEDQYEDGEITVQEYNQKLAELREMKRVARSNSEPARSVVDIQRDIIELKAKNKIDNAKDLKIIFGEIRPMGYADKKAMSKHLNNSNSKAAKAVKDAYNHYPTDWIEKSIQRGSLSPTTVRRGYYSEQESVIAISKGDDASMFEVAIHEIAHRMEITIDGMLDKEKEFYQRRTDGEVLEWLGGVYRKNEKTRKDNFLNPYMGKDYDGSAYELLTMGIQTLYTNPLELAKDEDMFEWIVGLLTML